MARTRFVFMSFVLATILASTAAGQVSFNVTYSDGANAGLNDNTIDSGETLTRGQLRRDTVTAVTCSTEFPTRGRRMSSRRRGMRSGYDGSSGLER